MLITVGNKIKYIRTFRGMTQYETNYRVPKKDMLEDIAEARDVNNDDMLAVSPVSMWFNYSSINDFMYKWMIYKQELAEGEIIQAEYLEWKFNWPDTCSGQELTQESCKSKYQWIKSD